MALDSNDLVGACVSNARRSGDMHEQSFKLPSAFARLKDVSSPQPRRRQSWLPHGLAAGRSFSTRRRGADRTYRPRVQRTVHFHQCQRCPVHRGSWGPRRIAHYLGFSLAACNAANGQSQAPEPVAAVQLRHREATRSASVLRSCCARCPQAAASLPRWNRVPGPARYAPVNCSRMYSRTA